MKGPKGSKGTLCKLLMHVHQKFAHTHVLCSKDRHLLRHCLKEPIDVAVHIGRRAGLQNDPCFLRTNPRGVRLAPTPGFGVTVGE